MYDHDVAVVVLYVPSSYVTLCVICFIFSLLFWHYIKKKLYKLSFNRIRQHRRFFSMGLAVAFTFETLLMISYLQKAKKRKWCSKLDDDILFQAIWIIKIGLIWYCVLTIFIRIYIFITEINLVKAFSKSYPNLSFWWREQRIFTSYRYSEKKILKFKHVWIQWMFIWHPEFFECKYFREDISFQSYKNVWLVS